MDTGDVELTELEAPINEENSEESITNSICSFSPGNVIVQQLTEGGMEGGTPQD